MNYTSIHNHSDYSNIRFRDCPVKVQQLLKGAIDRGYRGLCLTDHEALGGHVNFLQSYMALQRASKAPESFRIGLGNEIYLVHEEDLIGELGEPQPTIHYHCILIAKDIVGWRQLRLLSTRAWKRQYYEGVARIPTLYKDIEQFIPENERGHLILSTACLGGELAKNIDNNPEQIIERFVELFGKGNVFLEMQPRMYVEGEPEHEQVHVNRRIVELAEKTGVPYIVSTDTHYLNREDRALHEAFLNDDPKNSGNRELSDFYETTYMMEVEDIKEMLGSHLTPEQVATAIENTELIYNQLEQYDISHPIIVPTDKHIPSFEVGHVFKDWYEECEYIKEFAYSEEEQERFLLYLIEQGFIAKGEEFNEVNIHRINEELGTLSKVSKRIGDVIARYYVTVRQLIHNILWKHSYVGPARGSVTGFYIAYLVDITQVNPIQFDLPAYRHLHESRPEMPDIDIDVASLKRPKIFDEMADYYGHDRVLQTATWRTLSSKSAVITACKGLGMSDADAHYIADLVPFERGKNWSLSDCFEGNEENDRAPVQGFINAVESSGVERLKDTMLQLEGVVCGRGIHASSQYIFNAPYVEQNALMRAPNGNNITAFNMTDSDTLGGLKADLLVIEALDKLEATINLLIADGVIEDKDSIKANYDAYLHPSVLDYEDPKIWEIIGNAAIPDLFQCDTDVGRQAVTKIKPVTVQQMASANSLMRLMPQPGQPSPIDVYVAYKNDISLWYRELELAGLSNEEVKVLEPLLLPEFGVAAVQETIMQLVMDPHIANFNMTEANQLRKAVAKKKAKLIAETKELYFKKGKECGTSTKLLDYVWNVQIARQLGYSFSLNHTTPYSIIAVQEASLVARFGPLYWGAAVLTVNAGAGNKSDDEEDTKTADYSKIARAVGSLKAAGIKIALPSINHSAFGFKPDNESNAIFFALKAIRGLSDDQAATIIRNRPYNTFEEFVEKNGKVIKGVAMLQLIKAGAFDEIDSRPRPELMRAYLMGSKDSGALAKLTMRNFEEAISIGALEGVSDVEQRIPEVAAYMRAHKAIDSPKRSATWVYVRDENCDESFFYEEIAPYLRQDKDYAVLNDGYTAVTLTALDRGVDKRMAEVKERLTKDPSVLQRVNEARVENYIRARCPGNTRTWEMDALLFYHDKHELEEMDCERYHVEDFDDLPPEPVQIEMCNVQKRQYARYKLTRIAGTVLGKNTNAHKIILLTTSGIVTVKYYKDTFVNLNRRISEPQPDGTSKIIEKSWFERGNKLLITGFRRDDQFVARTYKNSPYQNVTSLIRGMDLSTGELLLQTDR